MRLVPDERDLRERPCPFRLGGHRENMAVFEEAGTHQTWNLVTPSSWTSILQNSEKYISFD